MPDFRPEFFAGTVQERYNLQYTYSRGFSRFPGTSIETVGEIDMEMSEAPSMTAAGRIRIAGTFVPVPGADNLFMVYNQHQEKWHLQITEEGRNSGHLREESPVFVIPEENIAVYSRCLIVRKDESGRIVDLEKDDLKKAKKHMVRMEEKRK